MGTVTIDDASESFPDRGPRFVTELGRVETPECDHHEIVFLARQHVEVFEQISPSASIRSGVLEHPHHNFRHRSHLFIAVSDLACVRSPFANRWPRGWVCGRVHFRQHRPHHMPSDIAAKTAQPVEDRESFGECCGSLRQPGSEHSPEHGKRAIGNPATHVLLRAQLRFRIDSVEARQDRHHTAEVIRGPRQHLQSAKKSRMVGRSEHRVPGTHEEPRQHGFRPFQVGLHRVEKAVGCRFREQLQQIRQGSPKPPILIRLLKQTREQRAPTRGGPMTSWWGLPRRGHP